MARKKRATEDRSKRGRKHKHPEGRTITVAGAVPLRLVDQLAQWADEHEMTQSEAIAEAVRRLVT